MEDKYQKVAMQKAFEDCWQEIEDYLADESDLSSRIARLLCYRLSALALSGCDSNLFAEVQQELEDAITQCPWFEGLVEYQLDEMYHEEEG